MPTAPVTHFSLEQIGTGTARFPSGVPIPTHTDQMVDPYFKSRMPKEHQVDCLLFWPQQDGIYPGLVLLHDWWGLTGQMKDLGARLACEGYMVIIPNLYGRLGGMVTANDDVAAALLERQNEAQVITDINSCCEYLNTRTTAKKNIHGVVGYGMGGSYALRFACHRKRLRAAVSYYGKMVAPSEAMKDLFSLLLHATDLNLPTIRQERVPGLHRTISSNCGAARQRTASGSTSIATPTPRMGSAMR